MPFVPRIVINCMPKGSASGIVEEGGECVAIDLTFVVTVVVFVNSVFLLKLLIV